MALGLSQYFNSSLNDSHNSNNTNCELNNKYLHYRSIREGSLVRDNMNSSIMSAETGIMTHTTTTGAAAAESSVTQQMSSGLLIEMVLPVDNIETTAGAWQTET